MDQPAVLEDTLAPYFTTKAPFQFPVNFREGFVKYWPIVLLVSLALTLNAIIAILKIGPINFLSSIGLVAGIIYTVAVILSAIALILAVLALPRLFSYKRSGWILSYYTQLISIVSNLFFVNILGVLLGLIFLMLLFQVRNYYS